MISSALTHDIQAPDVCDSTPEGAEQDQGNEEIPGPGDKLLHDVPSSSGSVTHVVVDKDEETVITTPDVSDPNPEGAEQDQGNEEISGLGDKLLHNVFSSSGSVTHVVVGKDEETVITTPDIISDPNPEDTEQDQGIKDSPGPADQLLQDVPSSSRSATHADENDEMVVTSIQATDVTPVQAGGQSFVERECTSGLTDEEAWTLSVQLLDRFQQFGDLADLQQVITLLEARVRSTSIRDHRYLAGLMNLGVALLDRFRQLGELSDLNEAISRLGNAVDFTSIGYPDKLNCLRNLGTALMDRFRRLGDLSDLEQATSRHSDAVDLIPDGHPLKPGCLSNLADSFLVRFQCLRELSDLEHAVSRHMDVVDLTPDGHPDKPVYLSNLGRCLLIRFQHLGELSNIEQAIWKHRNAVDLTPDSHPRKHAYLSNLGNALAYRFTSLGELSDLEQAISSHRDAAALTPDGHPDKPRCLNNLCSSILIRFECLGELSDLEQAISRCRDVIDLTPDGHPDKPGRLTNIGNSLLSRFERLGELSDLEQAISRYRDAVELSPDSHPNTPGYLYSLGNAFLNRFQRLGELSDLEQAISRYKDAVNLTPDGHSDKYSGLSNLGSSFFIRFQCLGDLSDLEQAISRHSDAVDLIPDGHPRKPGCLNNLGSDLMERFKRLGKPSDIKHAISRHMDAVDLTPDGHPEKPIHLNALGVSFLTHFEHLRELHSIEQAILMGRDAVDLTPHGHPHKPTFLNSLGNAYTARFQNFGQLSDLEEAISRYRDAIDLIPDGHRNKPTHMNNLGNNLRDRFKQLGQRSDLEEVISLCSRAACSSTGFITIRFLASQNWISCARALGHHSLLRAYSSAIGLLPQLAWIGLPLTNRYRELMQGADVVREAAAAALDSGLPGTAVEWLEQGRSIVWGELFQLRSSYAELSSAHPDHARRLQQLSAALELASSTHEKALSSLLEQTHSAEHRATESLEQEADRHRTLAIERDKLLQEIRQLPGFERFLLHKELSQLRASAHSGPVVILNAAESRCDALIILVDVEDVIHVPLPNFTLGRSAGLKNAVKSLLGHVRVLPYEDREGDRDHRRGVNWESVLSVLWNGVVKPVLDALDFSTPGEVSRIFWCPTGPFAFLPIHAAGLYGTQSSECGHKVSDFVVSSYIPTLSILAPSPKPDTPSSGDLRLLAVRQPPSDGLSRLPGVDTELEYIAAVIQSSPSSRATLLESSVGTVEEVLSLMKEADWVHFSCHGIQDAANPTDSGLCLANRRRLKLSDIIALSRPRGGLAFLSACQTAMGDEDLSDEAIHIAAGMLFAGYEGVVGTMWSISDRLAPQVAKDVYEQLFRNGGSPDYREAARALHDAIGRLRDSHASFDEWLPFIHVGL